MESRKAQIIDFLEEARKKKGSPIRSAKSINSQKIIGNNNTQVGGDLNINSKKFIRPIVQPGPEHISEEQAFKIYELVHKAVEIESITGKTKAELFQEWWGKVKNHYKVTSYKMIPRYLGDDAILFLKKEVAKLRPKLRRRDNAAWRKSLYAPIYARTRELGKDKSWVYEIVLSRIGKKVDSLTKLGEQDLKKLYNIIMSLKANK